MLLKIELAFASSTHMREPSEERLKHPEPNGSLGSWPDLASEITSVVNQSLFGDWRFENQY